MLVGSKTTRAVELDLRTGRVRRAVDGGAAPGGHAREAAAAAAAAEAAATAAAAETAEAPLPDDVRAARQRRRAAGGGGSGTADDNAWLRLDDASGDALASATLGRLAAGGLGKPPPQSPSLWLGRSDFTVKAFSPVSGHHEVRWRAAEKKGLL